MAESRTAAPRRLGRERTSALEGRSRVSAAIRLALALWLVGSSIGTLANPGQAAAGGTLARLLPFAGISFTLGIFLLSGFMSRVGGVLAVVLGCYEWLNLSHSPAAVGLVLAGIYLALRGGGPWAMDVYVERMQARVRAREAAEKEAVGQQP